MRDATVHYAYAITFKTDESLERFERFLVDYVETAFKILEMLKL